MSEEMTEVPQGVTEQDVVNYLQQNPGFFAQHSDMLHSLKIPHSKRGSVSLVERQLEGLRSDNQQLREEITGLMTVAQHNENISHHFIDFYIALLDCQSTAEVLQTLNDKLKEKPDFSSIVLKPLNRQPEWLGDRKPLSGPLATEMMHTRLGDSDCYLGRLKQSETELVFDDDPVASVALVLLEDEKTLLGFGSTQPSHFHPQLDITLLSQLRQLLSAVLARFDD